MAKLGIITGTTPNDGLGDNLLAGAVKINSNFSEIYNRFGDGTNLTAIGGTWTSTSAGIHTLKNVGIGTTNPRFKLEVGAVGASGTTLFVNGDARVTGIVTIGPASITLNGISNIINVGSGVTINGSTGTINATSINLGGTTLTGSAVTSITAGSGISVDQSTGNVTISATGGGGGESYWAETGVGIHTLSNVGIGTTNPTSALTVTGNGIFTGVITATTFVGALTGTATTATLATNAQGLTGTPDITVNKIVAGLTSSIIPFYWENFSDLPSFSTYHGAFAHVHQTGKAYYAHTRWVELVNKEANGTVGTGTENFNVGLVTATTLNVGTGGTVITTTTAGLVGIGTTNPTSALTVKGNTSLETLSVSGVSTFSNTIVVGTGKSLTFGEAGSNYLKLYSDGSNTYINQQNMGKLIIDASGTQRTLEITDSQASQTMAKFLGSGGGVELYYNNSKKFETIGAGVTVTGTTFTNQLNVSGVSTVGIITGATYYGDTSNAADGRWTLGASGINDYTFTGIGFTQTTNDPVLYLARGRVYEFVNNSGGSHPFEIRTSNGGSAYSNGVTNNAAASGIIRFEIPFNAPNTLYYQCTNHSGMGNTISVYPSTI